jgi:hypothetical protein
LAAALSLSVVPALGATADPVDAIIADLLHRRSECQAIVDLASGEIGARENRLDIFEEEVDRGIAEMRRLVDWAVRRLEG